MADIDDMLSNFDALLAKYQTTASPDPKAAEAVDKVTWPADRKADEQMDVVQQQERPDSPPPVFDVPSSPRADTPPRPRPPPQQLPAPTPAGRDANIADDYDEDFDDDFEEDIGGEDGAPAAPVKPPTPKPLTPAARAGRRAGAPVTVSASVNPLGEFDFGGKRLLQPVSTGWADRADVQEQERVRQEKPVEDARAEALRLERLEEREREEEEERRREDEEVERRIAAARRRKEEAAQRHRDADAERDAMAGGGFLTSVDLPDTSSARPLANPLAKQPHRSNKPAAARDSRQPPAKPPRPAPTADQNLVDALVSERERMADLARENAQLEAELGKVRREVDRVMKETKVLHGKSGLPKSAGAMRPVSKQDGRGARRPPSTADVERELRLAHNARRQLEYYAKEHEQLRRQVHKLASAEGEMESLSAVAAARVEALAAAAKKGKELARAQKEVQKALGAPQKEDPGRALVLLREEVRVLRERHGKVRGQAETLEKDADNHQARMAEVQADVDEYTRKLAEMHDVLRVRQEAVAKETAAAEAEAELQLRNLEVQVAEEGQAAAREQAEQRAKINDLVAQIKRERGRVQAAARISRAVDEELRELELKKKQRERARREARTAGRAAAETERAGTQAAEAAADAHAVSLLRAAALSPIARASPPNPGGASASAKPFKGKVDTTDAPWVAGREPEETASSDRAASQPSGRLEAAGRSRREEADDHGGGGDGSDDGLGLPALDVETRPQRPPGQPRPASAARAPARGEDQDHAAGVSYTATFDDFDEDSDLDEDVL